MIVKLTKRDGRPLYLNTRAVVLAEETPSGHWLVTVDALTLAAIGGPGSGVRSTRTNAHRVLDFDGPGAGPLVEHLDDCVSNRNNP